MRSLSGILLPHSRLSIFLITNICFTPTLRGSRTSRASTSELLVHHPARAKRRAGRAPEIEPRRLERHRRRKAADARSEEHTSELQSRFGISHAVFCLKK